MYLNKALVIGNLTRDPEMKALPSGMKVTSISVATNSTWKDAQGQKQEKTEYHNVVVFGRQAETASQYLKKGQSVMVEGRMQTRSWDASDGQKKYRTEIIADRVQFGPKAGGAGGFSGGGEGDSAPTSSRGGAKGATGPSAPQGMPPLETIEYPEDDINPDDIPF
jgi:single-strand DNA-binding protein